MQHKKNQHKQNFNRNLILQVYTVILPMMEQLMDEFEDKRDKIWSDCVGYQPYSSIVMDDLGVSISFYRMR